MPAMHTPHARALPAADQPHEIEHVQAMIEGMLVMSGFHVVPPAPPHPDRPHELPPPADLVSLRERAQHHIAHAKAPAPDRGAPVLVEWIGYNKVLVFVDGSSIPTPDEIVDRLRVARAQRLALDQTRSRKAIPHLQLTPAEISRGMVRPHWHSYRHADCGHVTVFEFDDRAIGLALDPRRVRQHSKGLRCNGCFQSGPIGERGVYTWVDTAGNDVPVKVGT